MIGIYKITNKETGDFYIGQSRNIEKRWRKHFEKGAPHCKKFQEALNTLGKDGFEYEVLEECHENELLEREAYYIKKLNPPYNVVFEGHEVSQETRDKISRSLTGRKYTPEQRARHSQVLKNYFKEHPRAYMERPDKRKKCGSDEGLTFDSVGSLAQHYDISYGHASRSLRSGTKVRGHKVWFEV